MHTFTLARSCNAFTARSTLQKDIFTRCALDGSGTVLDRLCCPRQLFGLHWLIIRGLHNITLHSIPHVWRTCGRNMTAGLTHTTNSTCHTVSTDGTLPATTIAIPYSNPPHQWLAQSRRSNEAVTVQSLQQGRPSPAQHVRPTAFCERPQSTHTRDAGPCISSIGLCTAQALRKKQETAACLP